MFCGVEAATRHRETVVSIATGKGSSCSCRTLQGQALRVSGKIILARRACGIFPRKPCMS